MKLFSFLLLLALVAVGALPLSLVDHQQIATSVNALAGGIGTGFMKTAATTAGCEVVAEYDQMEHIKDLGSTIPDDGGKGICYGLSVLYLDVCSDTATRQNFFKVLLSTPAEAVKAYQIYKVQKNLPKWEETVGLVAATEKDGTRKIKNINLKPGTRVEESKVFADWQAAATGKRMFMVSSSKHAMAAYGGTNQHFFDPNSGEVKCTDKAKMADFYAAYFAEPKIVATYGNSYNDCPSGGNECVKLTVSKYYA